MTNIREINEPHCFSQTQSHQQRITLI